MQKNSKLIRHPAVFAGSAIALSFLLTGSASAYDCGDNSLKQNSQSSRYEKNHHYSDDHYDSYSYRYNEQYNDTDDHEQYYNYKTDYDWSHNNHRENYVDDENGYVAADDYEYADYGQNKDKGNRMNSHDDYSEGSKQQHYKEDHKELRSNLQEHAAVIVPMLKAELGSSPDREAAMQAVDDNTQAIAAQIGKAIPGTEDEFSEVWQSHIDHYVTYVNATKESSDEGRENAQQGLMMFANDIGDWFAGQNSDYDADHITKMVSQHGTQTLAIVDRLAAHMYGEAYDEAHEAYVHMGDLADYIADEHHYDSMN